MRTRVWGNMVYMRKARLHSFEDVLAMCEYSLNDKRTYYKIYYPDFAGYSGIRSFYTSYFGKDVWVSQRTKNGKATNPSEYSVYSNKGVLLFAVHVSWIATMFDEYVEMAADRWRPKRQAPELEPELISQDINEISTLSMAAGIISAVAQDIVSVQPIGPIEPPVVLPPKADFSHLTFEQLFDV